LAPGIAAGIPGTDQHHERLLQESAGRVKQDTAQQTEEAQNAETEARTAAIPADTALKNAETIKDLRPPEELGKTGEDQTIHDLMTGEGGQPRINPDTQKPYTYLEAFETTKKAGQKDATPKTPNDFEQFYADWIKDNHFPDTAHNRLLARQEYAKAGQAPERPERLPRQMIVGPDGKVQEIHPGDTIAAGSKTVTGDLTNKPSADEQRRADLAENLNENLDQLEEIANRRPELFGPLGGRMTAIKGVVGSNDPDVGALETIKHQIGMAQISAHGMRSAHGIGDAAASILNDFKNGPEAVRASIAKVRGSVKTFQGDVEKAKAGGNVGGAPGKKSAADNDPLGIR
jgi:hypothetical protein